MGLRLCPFYCFFCLLSVIYWHFFSLYTPGSWLRMALLIQWSANDTTRSPAESDSGRALRTASVYTTRRWPEKLPLSPGQTEKIPGSAARDNRVCWKKDDGHGKQSGGKSKQDEYNSPASSKMQIQTKAVFMLSCCEHKRHDFIVSILNISNKLMTGIVHKHSCVCIGWYFSLVWY